MQTAITGLQHMVKAFYFTMSQAEFDRLPDRSKLSGLPVVGRRYRDSANPRLLFECIGRGSRWDDYLWEAYHPVLDR